jgi:membrane protein DedA with SNARE-associated domain
MDGLLHGPWVYLVLFLFAIGENSIGIGLVLPIDTLLVGAASLSALGELSAPEIVLVVFAGAVIGDSIGFLIGRRFGPDITRRLDGHLGINDARIEQARGFFERWGMWAVAVGRVIPVVRFLVVLLAGDLGLPYRRFIVADCIGVAAWLAMHFTFGYLVGTGIDELGGTRDLVIAAVVAVTVAIAAFLTVRWWRRRRRPVVPAPG